MRKTVSNWEKLLRTKIFGSLVRDYICSVRALVVQYRNSIGKNCCVPNCCLSKIFNCNYELNKMDCCWLNRVLWILIIIKSKTNKTARIKVKPWMLLLPFKVYGAVITLKIHWNKTKIKKKFSKNWIFLWKSRHTKYKRIDFAPFNKPSMADKLLLTNLERFLRRINSQLTR